MILHREQLLSELRHLRKGRAARHSMLLGRLGPQTRQLFGVSGADSPSVIRAKIAEKIQVLLGKQAESTQLVAAVVLGLHPGADQMLLDGRVQWLAQRLSCTERTVRRRMDEAFEALVDAAIATGRTRSDHLDGVAHSWRVQSFIAVYRLDRSSPEAIERRRIVFLEDGIQEIVYPFSIFRVPGDASPRLDVEIEVLYGLRLLHREQPIPEHVLFYLALPQAGRIGDIHEYGLRLTIPEGQQARPQYIYTPLQECDLFDLTVRFDLDALPDAVWRLEGALPLLVDHDGVLGERLVPDSLGEVHTRFRALQRGLGYGLKWTN